MYHLKICNQIKLICFIKFVVHKINSEMVKSRMVVLNKRRKTDLSFMYHLKICNQIKLIYFIKFVVHKINSKMVKFRMVVLNKKRKTDMSDTDVTVEWMLYITTEILVVEKERKN
jgi:uncharacterized protein YifN (PemK superfamily)